MARQKQAIANSWQPADSSSAALAVAAPCLDPTHARPTTPVLHPALRLNCMAPL